MYVKGFSVDAIHKFMILGAVLQLAVLLEFIVSFLKQAKQILKIHIFRINGEP